MPNLHSADATSKQIHHPEFICLLLPRHRPAFSGVFVPEITADKAICISEEIRGYISAAGRTMPSVSSISLNRSEYSLDWYLG
jgi:hypothetical protein